MQRLRKTLSDLDAPYMRQLVQLAGSMEKQTLIDWAAGYSERVLLPLWQKYRPNDRRPREALEAARAWQSGAIRLPQARKAILACHAAARESAAEPAAQAAARAIGHSASTIHSARHCLGLPLYGALAVAYDALGAAAPWDSLERCAADECSRMLDALRSEAALIRGGMGDQRI